MLVAITTKNLPFAYLSNSLYAIDKTHPLRALFKSIEAIVIDKTTNSIKLCIVYDLERVQNAIIKTGFMKGKEVLRIRNQQVGRYYSCSNNYSGCKPRMTC